MHIYSFYLAIKPSDNSSPEDYLNANRVTIGQKFGEYLWHCQVGNLIFIDDAIKMRLKTSTNFAKFHTQFIKGDSSDFCYVVFFIEPV
jgi:hypothetical protein